MKKNRDGRPDYIYTYCGCFHSTTQRVRLSLSTKGLALEGSTYCQLGI